MGRTAGSLPTLWLLDTCWALLPSLTITAAIVGGSRRPGGSEGQGCERHEDRTPHDPTSSAPTRDYFPLRCGGPSEFSSGRTYATSPSRRLLKANPAKVGDAKLLAYVPPRWDRVAGLLPAHRAPPRAVLWHGLNEEGL
jgi:hypothetical protein